MGNFQYGCLDCHKIVTMNLHANESLLRTICLNGKHKERIYDGNIGTTYSSSFGFTNH